MTRAFRACEALFAQYPQSARRMSGGQNRAMLVTGRGGRLYELVRYGSRGRRVFFRLFPAGQDTGIAITRLGLVPARVTRMLADAQPPPVRRDRVIRLLQLIMAERDADPDGDDLSQIAAAQCAVFRDCTLPEVRAAYSAARRHGY